MEDIKAEIRNIDYYQIFYNEAIMRDSAFPRISMIRPIFVQLSSDDFFNLVEKIFDSGDYELTTQFLYFLLLFRDLPHLQEFINSEKFTTAYLEKLVIFTYGFCTMHNLATDRIIDDILSFLTHDRLLDLVLNSTFVMKDKLLLFFILTKLDVQHLNKYFASIKDISSFKKYFMHLPDEILKTLISRNYKLFQYMMIMMLEGDSDNDINSEFFNKYKKEIEQFSILHDMIRQYKQEASYQCDRDLPFNERNMGRILFLTNMIKEMPDPKKAIDYVSVESVFIDEFEKNIVYAIVTNPVFKNIFKDYDRRVAAQ